MKKAKPFKFKQFVIRQAQATMKVGTDGVLLGAWASVANRSHALDIGTGTGLIAMMLAQRNPLLDVIAIEPDEASSDEALQNFAASPFYRRLQSLNGRVQELQHLRPNSFDLIVSNPPFFLSGSKGSDLKRHRARHTSSLSFDDLLVAVKMLLKEKGLFSLILPPVEAEIFKKKALLHKLHLNRCTYVFPKESKGVERLLMEFSSDQTEQIIQTKLVINEESGRNNWTPAYRALTQAFHTVI